MDMDSLFNFIDSFNADTHGSSDYYKDTVFVVKDGTFAPLFFFEEES
ncbi:hypothetical protein M901_1147 [Bacteriovorax sp. DB6_IX]|nr:hypothetical protein M901_1147 [Bacteriovorax sp. DB6_IX]